MTKILVTDPLIPQAIELLKSTGFDVDEKFSMDEGEFARTIPNYEGMVIRSGVKVTKKVIDAASKLKIIARAGVGVDNVDLGAAAAKGIIVENTPFGNINAAAEHTLTLMMMLAKHVIHSHISLKKGEWERKKFVGTELKGKTLGIIGLGKIGAIVANVSKSLSMSVISYDPFLTEEKAKELGIKKVDFNELLKTADYITVHVPLNEQTKGIISKPQFDIMKRGVRILNVSRGGIINEKDLAEAIENGKVAAAAIDVWENEPPKDSELLKLEQVIATPHLGASTIEAQENVGLDAAQQIVAYFKEGKVINQVKK